MAMTNSSGDSSRTTIVASKVGKEFPTPGGAARILHDIDLSVAAGEFLAVVGPSGSGKSTLLHCLAGLDDPTSGSVELLGLPLQAISAARRAAMFRRDIGFVFQNYNLIPTLSAGENVALPARLGGARVSSDQVDAALADVGLAGRSNSLPSELSGGEQQRVALARALFVKPALLFADEPTGALDADTGSFILDRLEELAARGSSVVLVTHDLEAAARADRVVVLHEGAVIGEMSESTPERILAMIRSSGPTR